LCKVSICCLYINSFRHNNASIILGWWLAKRYCWPQLRSWSFEDNGVARLEPRNEDFSAASPVSSHRARRSRSTNQWLQRSAWSDDQGCKCLLPNGGKAVASTLHMHTEKTPLLIGLRAAKANIVPGLIIQAMMAALLVAYYTQPVVHGWLSVLADAKQRGGYAFSMVSSSIAGGILPEILLIVVFQAGKFRRVNAQNLLFTMPYWAFDGLLVDIFYRYQATLFGSHVDFPTVLKKVLLDQLLFTPFITTPIGMACYEWRNQDFSFRGMSRAFTFSFYKNKSFPALIACWGVWIPLVAIIYSLPMLLQVPLFSLGLTLWVILFNYINAAHKTKSELSFSVPGIDASRLQP